MGDRTLGIDLHDLTHIDLFSGIGGFALAARWAGFRTVAFCEIEPFCQEVLKARFGAIEDTTGKRLEGGRDRNERVAQEAMRFLPSRSIERPILIPDIRGFDGSRFQGATLLTGGVPCQPASVAGKRKGTKDDRWLWPEAIRVLAEVKPTWAIFENPCGILSLEQGVVFEDLLSQMEGKGYEVRPIIIPACAVNAPHRRDRVWILAYNSTGSRFLNGSSNKQGRQVQDVEVGKVKENEPKWNGWFGRAFKGDSDAPDAEAGESRLTTQPEGREDTGRGSGESWDTPWIEVATRLCGVDARVSNRVDRLKALGNAIVPQVAYRIIKAIAEIEED